MKKIEDEIKLHEMRMEELEYIRTTEKIKHSYALERGRIKNAEIRKSQEREMRILETKKELKFNR